MAIHGKLKLVGLQPFFRPYVDEALDWMDRYDCEPVVTSGLRSMQEQAKLYAQGRTVPGQIVTKARPGESAHNYGLAVDVTSKRGYNGDEQRVIHEIFKQLGFGVISWDLPHGEFPNWRRLLQ